MSFHFEGFAELPLELLLQILRQADARTLCACALVCRAWAEAAYDNRLWQRLYATQFASLFPLSLCRSWKRIYGHCTSVQRNWRTGDCKLARAIRLHTKEVRALQLDESLLVTGSYDKLIKVTNLNTTQCVRVLRGHRDAVVALRMIDRTVLSGSADFTCRLYDLDRGECTLSICAHPAIVTCVDLAVRDGLAQDSTAQPSVLITGSADRTVRLWDARTRAAPLCTLIGHHNEVECVRSASEDRIVSGDASGTIRFWDVRTTLLPVHVIAAHQSIVWNLHADDYRVISCGVDGAVRIFDARTFEPLSTLRPCAAQRSVRPPSVLCLQFDGRNDRLLTGDSRGMVHVWGGVLQRAPQLRYSVDTQQLRVVSAAATMASAAAVTPIRRRGSGVRCLQADALRLVTGGFDHLVRVFGFDQHSYRLGALRGNPQVHVM